MVDEAVAAQNAGGVDEHVGRPEAGDRLEAGVGADVDCLRPGAPNVVERFREPGRVAVDAEHLGAVRGKSAGDRAADPRAGPSDDDALSGPDSHRAV